MEWGNSLWIAIGLIFLIEGFLPMVSPGTWRRMFVQLVQMRDGQIRFIALLSIVIGAAMLVAA
jgi:uncharacterized protein YjeT (DUF2065 family)